MNPTIGWLIFSVSLTGWLDEAASPEPSSVLMEEAPNVNPADFNSVRRSIFLITMSGRGSAQTSDIFLSPRDFLFTVGEPMRWVSRVEELAASEN
jgi:hypothetical protein